MPASATIELPMPTYQQLQAVARRRQQPIATVVDQLLVQAQEVLPALPVALEAELAALPQLSNEVLWLLARSTLPEADRLRLEELHWKAQSAEGLTAAETQEQTELLTVDQHTMVRRTEAANLLRQRGQNISALFKSKTQ